MPELATNRNADRRRDFRRPTSNSAELMPGGEQPVYSCTILDESDGGLQVETEELLDLPEQLFIRFSDNASQLVRRCWANGTRAGYQFIEIVPAKRGGLADAKHDPGQDDFTAVKDFISIARTLLDLSETQLDCSPAADHFHTLLAAVPHARLQLAHRGTTGGQMVQLFAIPRARRTLPSQSSS